MQNKNIVPEVIVYFDDKCILCNKSVEFILTWEKNQRLKFSSINNNPVLFESVIKSREVDTIILKEGENYFTKSTAVLKISGYLKAPFPLFKTFYLIPVRVRDFIYDFIARNRHKWFGKTDHCKLLTGELADRFIL